MWPLSAGPFCGPLISARDYKFSGQFVSAEVPPQDKVLRVFLRRLVAEPIRSKVGKR